MAYKPRSTSKPSPLWKHHWGSNLSINLHSDICVCLSLLTKGHRHLCCWRSL